MDSIERFKAIGVKTNDTKYNFTFCKESDFRMYANHIDMKPPAGLRKTQYIEIPNNTVECIVEGEGILCTICKGRGKSTYYRYIGVLYTTGEGDCWSCKGKGYIFKFISPSLYDKNFNVNNKYSVISLMFSIICIIGVSIFFYIFLL